MRWYNQDPASHYASPYLAIVNHWLKGTDSDDNYFLVDDLVAGIAGAVVNLAFFRSGSPFK